MGLTDSQVLWRVEIPLALPEIMAGLRIASISTVGLATFAFLAGAGGLGEEIEAPNLFKSNMVVAGGLAVLLAAIARPDDPRGQRAAHAVDAGRHDRHGPRPDRPVRGRAPTSSSSAATR